MPQTDPNVTALLIARGMVDLHERVSAGEGVVQQDATMPPRLRRGLALLSGLCVGAGVEDLGASVHVAMERACQPFAKWGLPMFQAPFTYADVNLIDGELAILTADCREMASLGGSELSAQEDIAHEALRAAVGAFPLRRRDATYTLIREFIVRPSASSSSSATAWSARPGPLPPITGRSRPERCSTAWPGNAAIAARCSGQIAIRRPGRTAAAGSGNAAWHIRTLPPGW